jgi:hypothetical protein
MLRGWAVYGTINNGAPPDPPNPGGNPQMTLTLTLAQRRILMQMTEFYLTNQSFPNDEDFEACCEVQEIIRDALAEERNPAP